MKAGISHATRWANKFQKLVVRSKLIQDCPCWHTKAVIRLKSSGKFSVRGGHIMKFCPRKVVLGFPENHLG
eukprot:1538764-Rhodomonas_salina.1